MAQQPLDYQTILRAWQLQQQQTAAPQQGWFSGDAAMEQQRAQQQADEAARVAEQARLAEATRGRTWGEALGDTGVAIGQAVVGTGQAAYGLANLATFGGLDRATGMSENFAETQQILEGLKSDPYQRDKRQASAMFERGDIGGGVMQYAMNPELLTDAAIQSVPYMLGVAGLSRAAAGRAAAGLTGEAATAAASKAAVRANLAGQAGMTAGQSNVDIVNQAREQGYSEEDAQLRGLAGAPIGLLTAGISKLTGAADLESKAAQAFMSGAAGSAVQNKSANVLATVLAGTARESGEELLQSGQEKIGANLAVGKPWNEGVAEAASVGALLGGVLGGGMAALTVRRDSPLRQEISKFQGELNNWTSPGDNSTLLADAQSRELQRQLPTVEETTEQFPQTEAERLAVPELEAYAAELDNTIDVGAAELPFQPEADVRELTGLNAIVARQRATQVPRMGVEEIPVTEVAPSVPESPVTAAGRQVRPVQDIIRETAPIGAVAERFGMAAAAQEAARRSQTVSTIEEPPRAPIDLSSVKAKNKFKQDTRKALVAAGIQEGIVTEKKSAAELDELVAAAAAAGVRPGDADFMQVIAPVADRIARSKGDNDAGVSGAIAVLFPVPPPQPLTLEQRVDAAFDAPTPPVSRTFTPEPVTEADAPVGKVSKATGAGATNRAQDLLTFVAGAGGINIGSRLDLTGDVQNKRLGRGNVFTKEGTSLDDMVRKAWEAGYLTDADMADGTGGEAALRAKLQQSLAGNKVVPVTTLDAQLEAQYRARVEAEQQAANEAATDLYMEAPAVAVQAGITAPVTYTAAQPYSAADRAEYAKQDAAALVDRMIDQKAYEANPQPVLAAMVQLLDEAPNIPAYNRVATAIYAHPIMKAGRPYSLTDEQVIMVSSAQANALGRLGEIPFHLGDTGRSRVSDLERALVMTEDEYIAAVNPTGKVIAEEDRMILRTGDLDLPQGTTVVETYKDNSGNTVTVHRDTDGVMYAVRGNDVLGMMGPYEEGETVIDVVEDAANQGIGRGLAVAYLRENPFAMSGGFSVAGEANRRSAFRQLQREAGVKFRTGQTETTVLHAPKAERGDRAVNVSADEDDGVVYSLTAYADGVEGNAFVSAEANPDGSFSITESGIPESARGTGLGTGLYIGLLNDAFQRGAPFVYSDNSVSIDAQRIYPALQRRGFTVEQMPGSATDPETGALEADGPVFKIYPPAETGNRGTFDPSNPDIRYKQGQAQGVPNNLFDMVVTNASSTLGVKVQGHRTIADAERATGLVLPKNAKGFFLPGRKEIHVIQENAESKRDLLFTIAHEQGHQGLSALLGSSLRAATARMWSNAELRKRIKAKQSELGPNATRSLAAEEVLADMLAAGERLPTSVWAKLKAGIIAFFRDLLGYKDFLVTNDDVNRLLSDVAKVLKGEQPSMTRAYWQSINWINDAEAMAEASPKFSLAKASLSDAIEAAKNEPEGKVGSMWDVAKVISTATTEAAVNAGTSVKDGSINNWMVSNLLPLDQIANLYDNLFGGRINKLAELKQAKDHKFNTLNARKNKLTYVTADGTEQSLGDVSVNEVSENWTAWARKHPRKQDALNQMMSYASYYKLHPDRSWAQQKQDIDYAGAGFTIEDRQAALTDLQAAWAAVGTQGQLIYKQAQSIYKQRWNERNKAVIDEIKRLTGMTDADLKVADAPSMLSLAKQSGRRMVETLESASRRMEEGPYSPLQRNGDHVVTARDSAGNVVWFSAHDTKAEAEIEASEIQQSMDTAGETEYVVNISTKKQYVEGMAADPRAVEALSEAAQKNAEDMVPTDLDPATRAQLINTLVTALQDARLQAMPQNAFIKHTKKRKNVAGFDTNAHRAFHSYQLRSARDIANILFDGKIAGAVQDIDQYVKDAGAGKFNEPGKVRVDTAKITTVAGAVKRQHAASIDVVQSKVINALTQAAFIKFMTSPSQMFLNAMQTPMVAFPRMAAKYGAARSIKALRSALADYARSRTDMLGEKSVIDPKSKEGQVLRALFEDGTLDITQAHDLAGIANGGEAAISPYFDKAMRVMSYAMHKSENFNRQVTALGTVRSLLDDPKNATMSVAELTTAARNMVMATHYNYAQSNKPPIMQGPMGKLILQFQLYRFHTLAMISKDIRDAFGKSGTTDATARAVEIKEARAALAWIVGMQLAFVGSAGTILAPFVFALLDAFKDEDDLTDSRQDWVNFAGKYVAHGVLAGVIDTQRIAADQLIPYLGDKAYEPVGGTPSDVLMYHITKNLGPSVGLLKDSVEGTYALMNGEMEKAVAKLAPKPVSDVWQSAFNSAQGVQDMRGVAYYEPTPWSTMLNVVGLKSGERRDVEADRGAVYKAKAQAYATKQRYLTLLAAGYGTGDADQIAEANEKINTWNQQYPDMAITAQDRKRAVVMRIRSQQVAQQYGIVATRAPSATINEVMGR